MESNDYFGQEIKKKSRVEHRERIDKGWDRKRIGNG